MVKRSGRIMKSRIEKLLSGIEKRKRKNSCVISNSGIENFSLHSGKNKLIPINPYDCTDPAIVKAYILLANIVYHFENLPSRKNINGYVEGCINEDGQPANEPFAQIKALVYLSKAVEGFRSMLELQRLYKTKGYKRDNTFYQTGENLDNKIMRYYEQIKQVGEKIGYMPQLALTRKKRGRQLRNSKIRV